MVEHVTHEVKIRITVLVDGIPEQKEYPSAVKVEEVIKSLLLPGEKQNWNQYQLTQRNSKQPLDPQKSLLDTGVKDGDTLSFTKKDGGGGN